MRFESQADLSRERKAITTFVNIFKGSFKKLDPNDIDFRVFDSEGDMIAYVEVKGRLKKYKDAFPLPVAARKLVKLADKRLNPVMIWACEDGIVYSKVCQLNGSIRWGGRPPRKDAYNDQELMIYFDNTKNFKYIPYA
jgi:hypothetical protein|tara:strand:+ start:10595 stop:11008 length:414 start_codon:yes stop_codon:yes gene_type:complete